MANRPLLLLCLLGLYQALAFTAPTTCSSSLTATQGQCGPVGVSADRCQDQGCCFVSNVCRIPAPVVEAGVSYPPAIIRLFRSPHSDSGSDDIIDARLCTEDGASCSDMSLTASTTASHLIFVFSEFTGSRVPSRLYLSMRKSQSNGYGISYITYTWNNTVSTIAGAPGQHSFFLDGDGISSWVGTGDKNNVIGVPSLVLDVTAFNGPLLLSITTCPLDASGIPESYITLNGANGESDIVDNDFHLDEIAVSSFWVLPKRPLGGIVSITLHADHPSDAMCISGVALADVLYPAGSPVTPMLFGATPNVPSTAAAYSSSTNLVAGFGRPYLWISNEAGESYDRTISALRKSKATMRLSLDRAVARTSGGSAAPYAVTSRPAFSWRKVQEITGSMASSQSYGLSIGTELSSSLTKYSSTDTFSERVVVNEVGASVTASAETSFGPVDVGVEATSFWTRTTTDTSSVATSVATTTFASTTLSAVQTTQVACSSMSALYQWMSTASILDVANNIGGSTSIYSSTFMCLPIGLQPCCPAGFCKDVNCQQCIAPVSSTCDPLSVPAVLPTSFAYNPGQYAQKWRLPAVGNGTVLFQGLATSNLTVALTSSPYDPAAPDAATFVFTFGTSGARGASIRYWPVSRNVASSTSTYLFDALAARTWGDFWVSVSSNATTATASMGVGLTGTAQSRVAAFSFPKASKPAEYGALSSVAYFRVAANGRAAQVVGAQFVDADPSLSR